MARTPVTKDGWWRILWPSVAADNLDNALRIRPHNDIPPSLHGLDPAGQYELTHDVTGERTEARGTDLMQRFDITLETEHSSELIVYRRVSP